MKKIVLTLAMFLLCGAVFAAVPTKKEIDEWNSLTEDEQMLCLLTEPYYESHGMKLTAVNPEPKNNGKKSMALLDDGFDLLSRSELIEYVENYKAENDYNSKSYAKCQNYFSKYPNCTTEEIAVKECLSFAEIAELCFYSENKDKLGEYGFLALNIAKEALCPLRLGVAVNWLTEAEAVELAKPFMEQLLNAYDCWEDFAAHYYLGNYSWAFFYYGTGKEYGKRLEKVKANYAKAAASKYAVSHDIKFTAQNQNGNPVLTLGDMFYTPSDEAQKWYTLRLFDRQGEAYFTKAELEKIKAIKNEKQHIPAIAFEEIIECSTKTDEISRVADYIKAFEKVENKRELYQIAYICCGMAYFNSQNAEEKLLALVENQKNEPTYYYLVSIYEAYRLLWKMNHVLNNFSYNNIESVIAQIEEPANNLVSAYFKAKSEFPINVKNRKFKEEDFNELLLVIYAAERACLFSIYSEACYLYFDARDYEKAAVYSKKAREAITFYSEWRLEPVMRELIGDYYEELLMKLELVERFFNYHYSQPL